MEKKRFDVISWLSSRTGYSLARVDLERIAMERGVADVDDYGMLDQRDKDLTLADMLFLIYTSPTETAAMSSRHGEWERSIGSQRMTDKRHIYELMMALYRKWDDPMAAMMESGGVQWIDC